MELYDLPSPPLFVDQPLSPDLLADERDEAVDMTEVEEPYIPVVVIVEDQDDDNDTVSDVASETSTLNDEDDLSQAMVGIEQSMSEDEMQEYLDFLNSMPWEDDVFPTLKNPFNFYKYNERVCAPLEVVAIDSYGFVTTYIDYRRCNSLPQGHLIMMRELCVDNRAQRFIIMKLSTEDKKFLSSIGNYEAYGAVNSYYCEYYDMNTYPYCLLSTEWIQGSKDPNKVMFAVASLSGFQLDDIFTKITRPHH